MSSTDDPDEYVRENRDILIRIIKHGDDQTARALALSVLTRFGDEPTIDDVEQELERAKRSREGDR